MGHKKLVLALDAGAFLIVSSVVGPPIAGYISHESKADATLVGETAQAVAGRADIAATETVGNSSTCAAYQLGEKIVLKVYTPTN